MILSLTILIVEYYYALVFLRSTIIRYYGIALPENESITFSSLFFLSNTDLYLILDYYCLITYRSN